MKLHAVLCFYDESPTWLAASVASLTRIDVAHVLAVDGRYPHFKAGYHAASPIEQHAAILETASACGIAVTLHRPIEARLMEPAKRELAHRLLGELGTPMRDWFIVIDADEIITDATHNAAHALAAVPPDTHAASCRISVDVDPYASPDTDTNVNERTQEIHQKMPNVDTRFTSLQSRFWRVMHDMRVGPAHYDYTGVDDDGMRWRLRPDVGAKRDGLRDTAVARVDCEILHRKNTRTANRRTAKAAYYALRDELGIER